MQPKAVAATVIPGSETKAYTQMQLNPLRAWKGPKKLAILFHHAHRMLHLSILSSTILYVLIYLFIFTCQPGRSVTRAITRDFVRSAQSSDFCLRKFAYVTDYTAGQVTDVRGKQ